MRPRRDSGATVSEAWLRGTCLGSSCMADILILVDTATTLLMPSTVFNPKTWRAASCEWGYRGGAAEVKGQPPSGQVPPLAARWSRPAPTETPQAPRRFKGAPLGGTPPPKASRIPRRGCPFGLDATAITTHSGRCLPRGADPLEPGGRPHGHDCRRPCHGL